MPIKPVHVRGTELLESDTREQYRQKLARITLDSMVQFVGLLDASGTVLEINQVALDAVGVKLSDVEGRPFWTTFWWQVSDEINTTLRKAIVRASQGEFVRWDAEIFGRAGGAETIIIDASLCPVKDGQGNVVFITAEGRDITEKKAQEREIARQREELAKLDVLKTQFFANISHEFRTPLTLLLGPLEDALANSHGILPMGAAASLSTSHRNALRLLKLVNTMLDFSRIEAGRVQASYQATDLAGLTGELASNFQSLCEKAGLRLLVDCPPLKTGEPVYVDRNMWEKIVLNLLSNAFKFTLQGEIEVRLEQAEGQARLTVRDTGVGIPEEELPRMFERFHRIKNSRGRTHEGTGIGLALVQELVKLHGGTISVTSALGEGSTFTVTIPLGMAHIPADRIDSVAALASTAVGDTAFFEEALRWLPGEGAAEVLATDSAAGEKPRILWADDNADMRAYVSGLLAARFEIQAVPDGEAALIAARAHPPDLVLSDVMMPKLDGFGLLQALRADPDLREIPIVLVSARAGEESRIEGMEAGADDYLIKPFSARELVARVETHVRIARMRQEAKAVRLESEHRFRDFANTAPAILWITDAEGSCSFVSVGWQEFTGQYEDSVGGFGWLDALHPDDRQEAKRILLEATRTHEPFSMDYRLRRADGEFRWAMSSGRPRFDKNGGFTGFAGSVIEIHERTQAALSSALLSAIVESSDDAIISKDLNGVIRSWNAGAQRIFGYTAEEVIGKPITILIPPERLPEETDILSRLQRGERIDHFETQRRTKDGRLLSVSLTVSPVRDASGKVVGASKVARDVTKRDIQEQALREANAALTRANGDLQQFAYSASHDLQEPIRSISVYGEMLSQRYSDRLDERGLQYLSFMTKGAHHMAQLVKDLLAYTQTSETLSKPGAVDANVALEHALANVAEAIRQTGTVVSHDDLPTVHMQQVEMQQLFQNIIGNAIKYGKQDEAPRIHVSARLESGRWLFSIRDNGMGIAPAYKDTIFGIFKRLHTDAKYAGTGIGLAICQKIVERNGGRIWVESALNQGATFFFTLPQGEQ